MKPITVLIVDDSALIRQMFSEMLSAEPGIEVLDTACDPLEAREKIKRLNPDVLTLDIEMPKMDGISFLEKIMTLRPMPVIMISTLTQKGADASLRAMEIGAFDTIAKPTESQTRDTLAHLRMELVEKVRAAASANIASRRTNKLEAPRVVSFSPSLGARHLIAIGASTGGVECLKEIFLRLPGNAPPIVIAQHMPERFTATFAERLDRISQVRVSEARDGDRLAPGHAYIAPGNFHLKIARKGPELVCQLDQGPQVSGHRPSVDVLFHSVAENAGPHAIGVILTGMGKDGAVGLKAMREHGAYTVGQNEASCIVYGMPQAAKKVGAVVTEVALADIPGEILKHCEQYKRCV